MMPVPTHLRECVVPLDHVIDESPLKADIRCQCGSLEFELLYPGETHEWGGRQIPCTAEIDGKFFFVIKARCSGCSRENLLLDVDFHGWDGFVCHNPEQASIPRPSLVPWECEACGASRHTGTVQISTEGREDFANEAPEFPVERWPDGFGWFDLDVKCSGCGLETEGLVSCETM